MVQVTHFQHWMKYRQFKGLLLFRLSIYLNMVHILHILLIFINQYNFNSPWPYTAKSIDSQLPWLFPHMLIQALLTTSCKTSSQLGHMFEFSDFVTFSPYCYNVMNT